MKQQIVKIKDHVKEHKAAYIAAAGGIAIGVIGKTLFSDGAVQIVDSFKLQVKSPTTNNVVQVNLPRRGHPGNLIVCNETGVAFSSQNQASKMMGVDPSELSRHLNGKRDAAGGYTFTNLGEAQ